MSKTFFDMCLLHRNKDYWKPWHNKYFSVEAKNRKSILAHCKANNVDGNKHINLDFLRTFHDKFGWCIYDRLCIFYISVWQDEGKNFSGTFWLLNNVFFLQVYHFLITFLVLKMTKPDKKDKNWCGEKVHCLTMT